MAEPVTCIIPVHNGAATIERAVKSAVDAGCDYVIVYDDASTDDTLDKLEKIKYMYLDVYAAFPLNINQGVNYSRNFLCQQARDGLIIPLDADDTLCDITPLRNAWHLGVWVYGDYWQHEGGSTTPIPGAPAGALPRKELTGISFMFHKRDWLMAGGYDPDFAYCEDWAFQCNLTHHSIKPVYVETVVYERYLNAQGNERTSRAGEYWNFYHLMARRKYPSLFTVNR